MTLKISRRSRNSIYSLILDALFLFVLSIYTRTMFPPQTQSIAFGFFTSLFGIIAAIAGSFVVILRTSTESFLYAWSGLTGLLNILNVLIAIVALIKSGVPLSNFSFPLQEMDFVVVVDLLMIYGCFLSTYMIAKLFIRKEW